MGYISANLEKITTFEIKTTMVQTVVVEDNGLLRQMMSEVIKTDPALHLAGSFTSAEEFLVFLSKNKADIVLMDIGLTGMSGLEAIRKGKAMNPAVQFIVFTLHDDPDKIFEALTSGATGYVLKGTDPAGILISVHETLAGGAPMSASIARKVVESMQVKNQWMSALSLREQEILLSLKSGMSYNEISEKYNISLHTVRSHIRSVYEKLQVHSKTEAIQKVFKSF